MRIFRKVHVAAVAIAFGAAAAGSGCAGIEPWVAPYEREALADPLMALSRDPLSDRHRQHVQDVREGARGGGRSVGGGCGCN